MLTLAVVFLMKMISAHDVLLQSMSDWLVGDTPTYYIVERDNAYERWLEHNADLSTTPPPPQSDEPPYAGDAHLLYILSSSKTMDPPTLSVRVQLRWL